MSGFSGMQRKERVWPGGWSGKESRRRPSRSEAHSINGASSSQSPPPLPCCKCFLQQRDFKEPHMIWARGLSLEANKSAHTINAMCLISANGHKLASSIILLSVALGKFSIFSFEFRLPHTDWTHNPFIFMPFSIFSLQTFSIKGMYVSNFICASISQLYLFKLGGQGVETFLIAWWFVFLFVQAKLSKLLRWGVLGASYK